MNQILELSDRDFKAVITKMLQQAITNFLERKKIERKNYQSQTLYPMKLFFKNERDVRTESDRRKLSFSRN